MPHDFPPPPRRIDLLAGEPTPNRATPSNPADPHAAPTPPNRWLGVYFRCARQYTRVFRKEGATNYLARCPKCGQTLAFQVDPTDPNASANRFYQVSC